MQQKVFFSNLTNGRFMLHCTVMKYLYVSTKPKPQRLSTLVIVLKDGKNQNEAISTEERERLIRPQYTPSHACARCCVQGWSYLGSLGKAV